MSRRRKADKEQRILSPDKKVYHSGQNSFYSSLKKAYKMFSTASLKFGDS